MKLPYDDVHLIADPLYGYLRITLSRAGEIAEADVIDNPWVQRLKRIHQLQSSWWVFPTAEHSRFSHSLGTMHLAGQLARQVYPTLAEVEPGTPSLPLVEETLRLAGLLHDLGHGPFSHFCDEEYLHPVFGIDHEQISQYLIVNELGGLHRRAAPQSRRARSPRARRSTPGTSPSSCGPRRAAAEAQPPAAEPAPSRAGCACCTAPCRAPSRSTTWTTCGATRTCAASRSAPSTSTVSSTTPSAPPTASRSTSAR